MAELREIPFNHAIGNDGRIQYMSYTGHEAHIVYELDGTAWVKCSCQQERWRHHRGQTNEDILHTFNAHLSYATRPKLKVD